MRNVTRALTAAAAVTLGLLGPAVPAEASHSTCSTYYNGSVEQAQMCLDEFWIGSISGSIHYWNKTSLSQSLKGTLIVQRCSTTGTNCATITALGLDQWVFAGQVESVYTSSKAAAVGYKYKTCASITTGTGWSLTYACSPLHTPFT